MAIVAVAFGAGLATSMHMKGERGPTPAAVPGLLWPEPMLVDDFHLTDHRGEPFDHARLEGRWSFLFFGYTSCPDICPMTMTVLDEVKDVLAPHDAGAPYQFVMVSVDPGRDSPGRLKEYVEYFDPAFVGATAPPAKLEHLTRKLGIMHMKVPGEGTSDEYLVDHSASIMLLDPRGRLVGVFSPPHEPRSIADQARAIIDFVRART